MHRSIQTPVQGTVETVYKPLAPVKQNDLAFRFPGYSDTYIDVDINFYVRGEMVSSSAKDVDLTDTTAVANNLQCLVNVQSWLTVSLSHNRTSIIIIVPIFRPFLPSVQMLPAHICLTLIGTLIRGICSLAIPRQRRTLPPQTTDS